MSNLSSFNTLPARPEYISAVIRKLSKRELALNQVVKSTGLTRTQVACTLDHLIDMSKIEVIVINKRKYYKVSENV